MQPPLITTGRSNRSWSGCGSVLGRCASWRAGSDLPVSLSGEVAEAPRSRVARSTVPRHDLRIASWQREGRVWAEATVLPVGSERGLVGVGGASSFSAALTAGLGHGGGGVAQ